MLKRFFILTILYLGFIAIIVPLLYGGQFIVHISPVIANPPAPSIVAGATGNTSCPTTSGQTIVNISSGQNLLNAINAAAANTTIIVGAGTYAGGVITSSGTGGNPITICGNPSDSANNAVIISSGFIVTNLSYLTFQGLTSSVGRLVCAADTGFACGGSGQTANGTTNNISIIHNKQNLTKNNGTECYYLFGDNNLVDANWCDGNGNDFMDGGGNNVVIRNNLFTNSDGSVTAQHIDFFQEQGGTTAPVLKFSLIENNTEKNCLNDLGNCHSWQFRTTLAGFDGNIIRFNYVYNIDGSFAGIGDHNDGVSTTPNVHLYNNTDAVENLKTSGNQDISFDSGNGYAFNNIIYNAMQGGITPLGTNATVFSNGNLVFTCTPAGFINVNTCTPYSGSWTSPYSLETTYPTLHNINPLFSNYPTDCTIQANSPAKNAGVALTTVANSDTGSGTSLIVNDSKFFQSGWAGTNSDKIKIGANSPIQISTINTITNTITLSIAVTRLVGDTVQLYSDSNGIIRLNGNFPNIGACQ